MALTETSRRIKTEGLQLGVELMAHQKAIVYRMLDIESHVVGTPNAFAMMSDKPGAGKTYAILAAIYISNVHVYKECRLNVIVVPYNIYSQWNTSIQTIAKKDRRLRTKSISQYADILDAPNIIQEGVDIILTTSLFFNSISSILSMSNIRCHRVFFDEADTIAELLQTPMNTDMTWFVSASMESIFKAGQPNVTIGKYTIDMTHLNKYNCVCDPDFVNAHIVLPDPQTNVVRVDSLAMDFLWNHCVDYGRPKDQLAAMYWQSPKYGPEPFPFDIEVVAFDTMLLDVTLGVRDRNDELKRLEAERDELVKKQIKPETVLQQIKACKNELGRCERLMAAGEVLAKNLQTLPAGAPGKGCKLHVIQNILKTICSNSSHSRASVIVFTCHDRIFKWLRSFLEEAHITYKDLDGGNIKSMDKTIGSYKAGEFMVLLADSSMYSCGMNLENTSDIIFVHKMDAHKEKQVIGRAHRYGREGPLRIWHVYYEFEFQMT